MFSWLFVLVRFWAFLSKGSSKIPLKYCPYPYVFKKSMSKAFSETIDQKNNVSFIAFSGVSQRREFKNTTKNVLQNDRVEKFLQNNRQKVQNQFLLDFSFITFLGVSRLKMRLKNWKKTLSCPGIFWPPRNQPTTHVGVRDFALCGPLVAETRAASRTEVKHGRRK
jgi:hypothetical protein